MSQATLTLKLGELVPDFSLPSSADKSIRLHDLLHSGRVLLGFADDIWSVNSVRRVLWLQRHMLKLATSNIWVIYVTPNDAQDLQAFERSIPRELPFAIVSDADGSVGAQYGFLKSLGFLLIGRDGRLKRVWHSEEGIPAIRDLTLVG
jgi:peroxiredoxin